MTREVVAFIGDILGLLLALGIMLVIGLGAIKEEDEEK